MLPQNAPRATIVQKPENTINMTGDKHIPNPSGKARGPRGKTKSKTSPSKSPQERRARVFRKHPPKTFQRRLERALTQRMFVVGQNATDTELVPEMKFDIVGSTGNLYKVTIGKEPTCNCPDASKGNQCKHICYILVKALKAPIHLQYQLAFLSSELREIYKNSRLCLGKSKPDDQSDGKRKPVEGDCPICYMEFEPDKAEEIVWCRAACGNNIHKTCFQKWAISQRQQGVRCVYCRAPWQVDDGHGVVNVDLEQLLQGPVGHEGYINVAEQMGLPSERDCSTYYRPSGRRPWFSSGWGRSGGWY